MESLKTMGTGFQVLAKEVAGLKTFEEVVALRDNLNVRVFSIPYARPPGRPDSGIGKAVRWKRYWKRMNIPKPSKDGGAKFFEYIRTLGIPGAAKLESGLRSAMAFSRAHNPKGKMRVYNGLMYNEKHIAMMEAAGKK